MASQAMPAAIESPLVVASNRGPVSFRRDEGGALVGERGPGGLVTALASVLFESDATWLAAAQSDVDRELAASGKQIEVEPMGHAGFIDPPADRYDGYYNGISNRVLWLLHHYLFDLAYLPAWDMETRRIWQDYRDINRLFAEALHREEGRNPVFLIQDYHLSLVPQYLRELQPDARITHFSHTPFCGPTYLRLLPAQMREDLLRGMLGADVLGFQAERWVVNFLLGVRDSLPDARVDVRRRRVDIDGRQVRVRAYPIALDPGPLRRTAASADVKQLRKKLGAWRGDAKLLLRVDRLELSKNIVRGYQAYELFLRDHPEWRGRVQFLSLLPRSRTEIPEYIAYAERCLETAAKINEELGTPDWTPIEIRTEEDYPQAVAAYGLYDVLMVNPVFDGMNLVAMEGPLVNRRNGALILSSNAGAHGRLGSHAITVNPFDLAEMADAIRIGLEMPEEERIRRERGLVRAVMASSPGRWLTSQLRDLDGVRGVTGGEGLEGLEQMDERAGAGEDLVGSGDETGRRAGAPHDDFPGDES